MPPRLDILRRWAQVHRLRWILLGSLILAVFDATFGGRILTLPFVNEGANSLPMRRELPAAFAALMASSLGSQMSTFERSSAHVHRRWLACQLGAATTLGVAIVGTSEFTATGASEAAVAARSFLIWVGLSLISAALFEPHLSWILPLGTIFPLTYVNRDSHGYYYWWVWTHRDIGDSPTWMMMGISLLVGAGATFATPWHWQRMLRYSRIGRRVGSVQAAGPGRQA